MYQIMVKMLGSIIAGKIYKDKIEAERVVDHLNTIYKKNKFDAYAYVEEKSR